MTKIKQTKKKVLKKKNLQRKKTLNKTKDSEVTITYSPAATTEHLIVHLLGGGGGSASPIHKDSNINNILSIVYNKIKGLFLY